MDNVHAYYTATHQINKQMEIRFLAVYYEHPVRKNNRTLQCTKKPQGEHYNHFTIILKLKISEVIFTIIYKWNARWNQFCVYEIQRKPVCDVRDMKGVLISVTWMSIAMDDAEHQASVCHD